ncbi:hypothetical protein ACP3TJ_09220 [Desulforudis sp. 1088]|uniref:hypothetical protein n=1 Tax=unclassified Candidatus Desulforudis TaxID=2635950 RepID=UPI003CE4D7B5
MQWHIMLFPVIILFFFMRSRLSKLGNAEQRFLAIEVFEVSALFLNSPKGVAGFSAKSCNDKQYAFGSVKQAKLLVRNGRAGAAVRRAAGRATAAGRNDQGSSSGDKPEWASARHKGSDR